MFRWPARSAVFDAARTWAAREASRHEGLLRLGIFGSLARGDWGVGSDLDLVAILEDSAAPFTERGLAWDLVPLPVPAEIVVYTRSEWDALRKGGSRFAQVVERECLWIWPRTEEPRPGLG